MNLLINTYTSGLEYLAREVMLVFAKQLNDEIGYQQVLWAARDEQFAAALGITYEPTELEPIALHNMYDGHRPSLMLASIERYPNISIMAFDASPDEAISNDQSWGYLVQVQIEIMVKSGPFVVEDVSGQGEELVNRRIQRTTDAALACLAKNRSINGLVLDTPAAPTVEVGNVFVRREEKSRGSRFYWQGSVLTYPVTIPTPGY